MPTFDAKNYYFSGQGVAMLGSRNPSTGNPIGLLPVGNVPELKISVATTVVDHKGSQDGQRATDQRLQTDVKVTLSMIIENWNAANLAKTLRGDATKVATGSVVGESVPCFPGLVSGFKHIRASAVTVKQGSTTLTAYTDGIAPWDYKLNADAGSIMLNDASVAAYSHYIPTSPASGGDTLLASYTWESQYLVDSLTQPLNDSWIRFEGLNTVDANAPVVVDIYRFSNDPLKELSLLSDTFGQFALEGSVLKDDTRLTGSKYFSIKKIAEL